MRGLIATFFLCLGLVAGARAETNDGIAEFYAGHAALQQGDAQNAITHFSKALQIGKLDPTQIAYVHYYRAISYQRLDRHQDAIDGYTQALSFNVLPQRVQAALYYNRAIALDHLANFDRAIKDYSSAVALKPDYAEAYMNRGNAYRKLGDNDQALRDYAASASYGNPIKHLPYYGEGLVYEAKGDKENAFKAFQTALALAPDFEPARLKVEGYQAAGMTPSMTSGFASAAGTTPLRSSTATPQRVAMNGTGVTAATAFTGVAPAATPSAPVPAKSAGAGTSGSIAPTATPMAQTAVAPHASNIVPWDRQPASPKTAAPAPAKVTTTTTAPVPQKAAALTPAPVQHASQPQVAYAAAPMSVPAPSGAVGPAVTGPAVTGAVTALPKAVAPTQIASAEPAARSVPRAPTPTAATGTGGFLIQIAAYKDESVAQSVAKDVATKAGDLLNDTGSSIQRADLGDKGVYYRIQYGPFPSRGAATERCASLKSRGLACIIVTGAHS